MDGHGMKKASFLYLSGSKGNSYPYHCALETDLEMCEDGNTNQNKGHKGKESWKEGKLISQGNRCRWKNSVRYVCSVQLRLCSKVDYIQ